MVCGVSSGSSTSVPFWDETLYELNLQPLSLANRAHTHKIPVPRFRSTFALWSPSPNGSRAYPLATTPIIPQDVADTEGRTCEATLHFDRLGVKANCLRALFKKHRVLYIGSMPSLQEKP